MSNSFDYTLVNKDGVDYKISYDNLIVDLNEGLDIDVDLSLYAKLDDDEQTVNLKDLNVAGQVTSAAAGYGFTSNATSFPFTSESTLGNGGKAYYAKHTSSGGASSWLFYGENNTGEAFSVTTAGSITAAGSVKSTNGSGTAFLGATSGTGLAINDSGNNTVVELNYDGTASFEGGNITLGAVPGITGAGGITGTNFIANTSNGANPVYVGKENGVETSKINGDGSAKFAGDVQVGDNSNGYTAPGCRVFAQGTYAASRSGAGDAIWRGYQNSTTETSYITAGGSASFAGAVVSKGVNAAVCFQVIQTNESEVKAEITASGTATFAGAVTAGGYSLSQLPQL